MSVLDRLHLSHKFSILGVIALVLIAVPAAFYLSVTFQEMRQARLESEGLEPIVAINQVVGLTQVHRGMSASMFAGDQQLAARRPQVRDQLNQAYEVALQNVSTANAPAGNLEALQALRQRWVTLEQALSNRSINAQQSLLQHTQLINEALVLNETLLAHFGLLNSGHSSSQSLIQAALVQAPFLGENLGLLRAQGSAALAAGQLAPQSRGAMGALQRRVIELQGASVRGYERAMQDDSVLRQTLTPALEDMQKRIASSMDLLTQEVFGKEQYTLAASVYFDHLTGTIEATNALTRQATDMLRQQLSKERAEHQMVLILASILALALLGASIVLAIAFIRSITKPLHAAVEMANAVSNGDLSGRDIPCGTNEVGELLQAQQRMRAQLRPVIAQVRQGSESVATASAQIAQGNMDLSSRTESQASALEQTAASMEELGTTVRLNADSARDASTLADSARTVAQQGGEVVSQVVVTMQGITDASRKISDIIGVIDSIAFQTNILALNAAVEAARAGEQGRGFAVVAGEVRLLAQRSAEAAKEIKGLIQASVTQVEEGGVLVARAGSTMDEVVNSIRKVHEIVAAISSASQEQASGVSQVGEAVTQMDQATQQNAALVEEMAAAAGSLRNQAQDLVNAVSVFRWEGGVDTGLGNDAQSSFTRKNLVNQRVASTKPANGGRLASATSISQLER